MTDIILERSLTVFWSFWELLCIHTLADTFLVKRYSSKAGTLSFIPVLVLLNAVTFFEPPTAVKLFLCIGIYAIWICLMYRGSLIKQLLVIAVTNVYIGIGDLSVSYGISMLLGISFEQLVWKKLLYTAVVTVAKLLEFFIAYLFRRVRQAKLSQHISNKWILLTALFPAVSFLVVVMIFEGSQDSQDLTMRGFIISIILAVANFAILYLIRIMEKATEKETELRLLNRQMDIQTRSIQALEKSYHAQRKAVHEFQHHLQTIDGLLTSKDPAAAKAYINTLQKNQTERIFCIESRHPVVDVVLNQKYQTAKEYGIDIQIQVNDLSAIPIPVSSIVVILSNLLDNAIEACMKLPETPMIQCRFIAGETLLVSVRNTSQPVQIHENSIRSTKNPDADHGYGLINVRNVLEQLRGEYAMEYKDGWFQFSAEIPLEQR